jgi:purine-binding chemotaxis protein CheW
MYVTEVIALQKIVKVPDTPDFVRGVINLRGQVIPVMDVRIKFGMETLPYTERTCIVIVTINQNAVGLVVDVVNDVVSIVKENIAPPAEISRKAEHHFIKGFGKIGEEIKILLDTQKLIDEDLLRISSGQE